MLSLGGVFLLGIFFAFALHLDPSSSAGATSGNLKQRNLSLLMEELTGEPADLAAIFQVGDDEGLIGQVEAALRAILRLRSPEEQMVAAYRMVSSLPDRRITGAIRFLLELEPEPARDRVLGRFLEAWGGMDGRSAIFFGSKLKGSERQQAMAAAVRGWSRVDAVEAWNWVMERETNTRLAHRWVSIILEDQAVLNRSMAMDLLERLDAGSFQNRMGLLVFEQILQTELPETALSWLGQLPLGSKQAAYGSLALAMARNNPQEALRWLSESAPGEEAVIRSILADWAADRPELAVNWAWEHIEGALLADIMEELADIWMELEGPAPLADWLNANGPGPELDGAIEALAMTTLEMDPATALVWAQSVSFEEDRVLLEMVIGRQWIQRAPDEAMENLPFLLQSDEARATLIGNE
jgi:hypothetical protein